ncbi:MAG TPA: M48 family metallopeptidase [Symbiobacteriaceae bacterium]|jgi:Zn-dependent protease with chaperone function|nr:M48 family metallopeptidase [Symbiobacteriaceae bacterium]
MQPFWKTILLLLAVPVISFFVATAVQSKFNDELQQALLERARPSEVSRIMSYTMDNLCASPDLPSDLEPACTAYRVSGWIRTGAVWTGAGGLLLMLLIRLAGLRARVDRKLLWRVFRPGLYITMASLMLLMLANGALAMGALYYGGAVLFEVVYTRLIFFVGAGVAIGLYITAQAVRRTFDRPVVDVFARTLPPEAHREIWAFVTQLAGRMQAAPPTAIVAGLEPNFFVTESEVDALDGRHRGRTLYLSLPLSRILSVQELKAVIGHELGHFRGEDTRFSQLFFPIYRGANIALQGLARSMDHIAKAVAIWPAINVLAFFLDSFAVAESHLSRQRELVADQAGVEAAGVRAMGSALVKLHAFSDQWAAVWERMRYALAERAPVANASLAFTKFAGNAAGEQVLKGIADSRVAHPTDSHPPLGARLEALQLTMNDVREQALVAAPDEPAIALFGPIEAVEEGLTAELNRLIQGHGLVPEVAATAEG